MARLSIGWSVLGTANTVSCFLRCNILPSISPPSHKLWDSVDSLSSPPLITSVSFAHHIAVFCSLHSFCKDTDDKDSGKEPESSDKSQTKAAATAAAEEVEEVDIDLTDPDVEKAAIKIQAGFSRFKKAKKPEPAPEPAKVQKMSPCV